MKNIKYIMLIFCITLSCNRQIVDNSDIIEIVVDIQSSKSKPIKTFFSAIEVIPLETIDESLLKKCDKIIFEHDRFYIFDGSQHALFVFDEKGNFIQSCMHKKGEGPGEYLSMVDFDINPETGYIEILDVSSYRIRRYDHEFNFINETSLPRSMYPVVAFKAITDDLFVFYTPRIIRAGELRQPSAPQGECLQLYSASKKEVIGQMILTTVRNSLTTTQNYSFYMRGSDLFFTNSYPNNHIFKILYDEQKISKVIEFNFEKYTFQIEKIAEQLLENKYFMEINNNRFVFPATKHENDSCYYSFVMFKNELHFVSYNKQSGQTDIAPTKFTDGGVILPPAFIDNTYFYVVAQPDWIDMMVKKSLLDSQSQEVIKSLREDDNPVLLKYKIAYQ